MADKSIRVDAGEIRLRINDDPDRVITFNPFDLLFAEKFYALLDEFEKKDEELQERMAELAMDEAKDKHGLPKNTPETIALMSETAEYIHEKIDDLFGEGTSEAAFQGQKNLEMIVQFFEGIVPYINEARSERIEKYTGGS